MKMRWKVVLATALLFLLPISGDVLAVCSFSTSCEYPPDGYVACQATCQYPANCVFNTDLDCNAYCYYDWNVNACFDGPFEPCCVQGPGGF